MPDTIKVLEIHEPASRIKLMISHCLHSSWGEILDKYSRKKAFRVLWVPVSLGENLDQAQESLHEELFVLSLEAWSIIQVKDWGEEGRQAGKRTIYVKVLREDSICRTKNE